MCTLSTTASFIPTNAATSFVATRPMHLCSTWGGIWPITVLILQKNMSNEIKGTTYVIPCKTGANYAHLYRATIQLLLIGSKLVRQATFVNQITQGARCKLTLRSLKLGNLVCRWRGEVDAPYATHCLRFATPTIACPQKPICLFRSRVRCAGFVVRLPFLRIAAANLR